MFCRGVAPTATLSAPELPPFDLDTLLDSLPKLAYRLPDSPIRRQKEERIWVSFLTSHPSVWLGGEQEGVKADLHSFAHLYHDILRHRSQPPTQDFIVDELLPLWIEETRAEEVSAETLAALLHTGAVEVDELFGAKKWVGAQFLAYKNPASDIRYQFANVFRKLPLPVTKANYRSHVLATQLLLQIIDRKPHASDSNTELDAMSEVTSLWSNVEDNPNGEDMTEKLAAMDWAAVFKEQETLAANDERFIHRKDLPASTRQVVRTEKSHIFAGDSGKDVEAAHILANGPKNQILLFRTKVDLTLASGTVDRLSFHLNHPSNVFCLAPGLHRALDRDMIAIVPEIDWLAEVVDQLNRENEIRLKRMDAGKPVGLLMLHAQLEHWFKKYNGIGYNVFALDPAPSSPRAFIDNINDVFYSAKRPDASDRRGRPLFYFSRLSPHWQHQPNPFLFVFNAAAKLAHHPDRPIPDAVRPNMLLCLEIVVRVFSTPSTLLPIAATQAHVKALAREQLKMARATATPAAAKKKW